MNNDEIHEAVEKAENEDADESDKANEEPSHSEAYSSFTFQNHRKNSALMILESFVFGQNCELSILIDASKMQAKCTMGVIEFYIRKSKFQGHCVSKKRLVADLISNR
ncbi:hypothetical protein T12_13161 [Trichinella patagoniensis]|uniref:Uncharacterized protein n=1 Tax=Trichinella patagoniensis TaxID=990121 RepID=A0A0V0Z7V3_9BILA|nr:hypothetical protein T12_13161 [Trichinella patagoniensis]